jgi:DNA-binding transcriptional MerR regulator
MAEQQDRGSLRQIGEVAEEVGLSLRTVRFYEEVGLVIPAGRTAGGFRLYDDDSVGRLRLIMQMKPLGFTVEEMRLLIEALDALGRDGLDPDERDALLDRLDLFAATATEKCASLAEQLGIAQRFSLRLIAELRAHGRRATP